MNVKEFAKIYKMKSGKYKTLTEANKDIKHFIEALTEIFKDGQINSLAFNNFGRFYTEEVMRNYVHPITKKKLESRKVVLRFKPSIAIIEKQSIEE